MSIPLSICIQEMNEPEATLQPVFHLSISKVTLYDFVLYNDYWTS